MTNSYDVAADINLRVNRSVTYMEDAVQYGVPDYFEEARPGGMEDCDGYALAKRGLLLKLGWPYEKQMLCTCIIQSTGQGHMVEAVETDKGWFILCNNYDEPMSPNDLPYTWISCVRNGEWKRLSWA